MLGRLLALLAAAAALTTALSAPLSAQTLLIEGANVVDVVAGEVHPNQSILIRAGRIVAISSKIELPDGAQADTQTIDAKGKYVIPGLWDMHVHIGDPAPSYFSAYIKYGITGVREMLPEYPLPQLRQWGDQADYPRLLTPALLDGPLLGASGPLSPGSFSVGTADQARAALLAAARGGYDFVKVYNSLPRDAYLAAVEQAKVVGLPIAGHVPEAVSPLEAAQVGQRSQEHLINILLACSSREEELRAKRLDVLNGVGVTNEERARELGFPDPKSLFDTYDPGKASALFAAFAKSGTWQTPTLSLLRSVADENHDLRGQFYTRDLDDAGIAAFRARVRRLLDRYKLLVRDMHKAGVELLAGTDSGPSSPNPPGESLHDELALLVEAGLTPTEALRTATVNAARYLDGIDDAGTVEVGKVADLTLLDANPLADIRNTRKVSGVVIRGRQITIP